eukprot:GHVO01054271.1.p1 GENE.GHVO01054271.1~~GHVO01054271.1.p1  ORF type:complete len:289 (-),score=51.12 GHVO01054271.1:240-1106(-)
MNDRMGITEKLPINIGHSIQGFYDSVANENRELATTDAVFLFIIPKRNRVGQQNKLWERPCMIYNDIGSIEMSYLYDDPLNEDRVFRCSIERSEFSRLYEGERFYMRDADTGDEDYPAVGADGKRRQYCIRSKWVSTLRDGAIASSDKAAMQGIILHFARNSTADWPSPCIHYIDEIDGCWKMKRMTYYRLSLADDTTQTSHVSLAATFSGNRSLTFVIVDENTGSTMKKTGNIPYRISFSGCYVLFQNGELIESCVSPILRYTVENEKYMASMVNPIMFDIATPSSV